MENGEWCDAAIVFADDVRNKGPGIEAGRVYKGIDGSGARGSRRKEWKDERVQ